VAAWALVAVGGVVRITESGLGCPDWPLCEGKVVPAGSGREAAFEFSHRATAAATIVLALAVFVWAWARYRDRKDLLVPATVAVAFIPGQALLGAVVVWLELPGWMVGVHFVIGLLFLAATCLTAVAAWPGAPVRASAGFVKLARATLASALVLVSLGAAVVATGADNACGTQWPGCNGSFAAGGSDAALQVAHRMAAYLTAALLVALAVSAWRGHGPRLLASLPLLALAAQMGFGIALVVAESNTVHDVFSGLHVAWSGAVWALIVVLAARVERPLAARVGKPALGAPATA
jgi:heme A synthase